MSINPLATPVIFNFQEAQSIRIVLIDNAPWFVAKDICDILQIQNPTDAIKSLDGDERARFNLGRSETTGGGGLVNIISESGMYALVMRSRDAMKEGTPQHRFRKWVTSEVLPAIRKTGSYTLPAKTQYNGAPLSRDQTAILNGLLHRIKICFIGSERASQAAQNRLRVDLHLRSMQDLRAQHFEHAKAILEDIHRNAKAYQAWRNTAENQAIEHLIHDGRPWTPTLVGKLKKQLGLTVGKYPDWHKLANAVNR